MTRAYTANPEDPDLPKHKHMLHNNLNSVDKSCSSPTRSLGTCGGASQALPRNDQRKASDPAILRIGRENMGTG